MKTIWLVPLEKIETRYTYEWADHIPKMIERYCADQGMSFFGFDSNWDQRAGVPTADIHLVNILGSLPEQTASSGAFINFASTNVWKSTQAAKIAEFFHNGFVNPGDVFYFTDSWNPTIIQVKYMSELLNIPVTIVGQWHAGWHDPYDFLGRTIKNPNWVSRFEASLFHAIDVNLFTTNSYREMFYTNLDKQLAIPYSDFLAKTMRVGYPNSYLETSLGKYFDQPKDDVILFPHRIAPEKQLEIFKDLEQQFRELGKSTKFIVCQEKQLTKAEYHELLGKSKVVFSAALQETYGIAQTEAVFAGAVPCSPDRLSYSEMYSPTFLYPSCFTASWKEYLKHRKAMVGLLVDMVENFEAYAADLPIARQHLRDNYIGDIGICKLLVKGEK